MNRAELHASINGLLDAVEKDHGKFPTQIIILMEIEGINPADPGEFVAVMDIYPQTSPAGKIIESLMQAAGAIEASAKAGMMPDIAPSNDTKH